MRPQQQNRRMRGRNNNNNNNQNNNNRRGPNPLTRSYESNGPDVKIRGSAQQIAEKYATLARDATSAGDRVMAENYLQHAEHYNRIIAAAQAQMPIQQQQAMRDDADDDMDDERDEFDPPVSNYGQNRQRNENFQQNGGHNGSQNGQSSFVPQGGAQAPAVDHAEAPQPVIEGVPAEVAFNAEGQNERSRDENRRDGRQRDGRDRRRDRRFDNLSGVLNGGQPSRPNGEARASDQNAAASESEAPLSAQASVAPAAAESLAPSFEAAPAVSETVQPAEGGEQSSLFAGASTEGETAARRGRRPRRPRRTDSEEAQGGADETPSQGFDPNLAPVAE